MTTPGTTWQRGTYAERCAADMDWRYRALVRTIAGRATISIWRGPYWISDHTDPRTIPAEILAGLVLPRRSAP